MSQILDPFLTFDHISLEAEILLRNLNNCNQKKTHSFYFIDFIFMLFQKNKINLTNFIKMQT